MENSNANYLPISNAASLRVIFPETHRAKIRRSGGLPTSADYLIYNSVILSDIYLPYIKPV
jgi:hypothetical protein